VTVFVIVLTIKFFRHIKVMYPMLDGLHTTYQSGAWTLLFSSDQECGFVTH